MSERVEIASIRITWSATVAASIGRFSHVCRAIDLGGNCRSRHNRPADHYPAKSERPLLTLAPPDSTYGFMDRLRG